MGSRNNNAAGVAVSSHGKIDHVRGNLIQVGNITAGVQYSLYESFFKRRGRRPYVYPDGYALWLKNIAVTLADGITGSLIYLIGVSAADIIGVEDAIIDCFGVKTISVHLALHFFKTITIILLSPGENYYRLCL